MQGIHVLGKLDAVAGQQKELSDVCVLATHNLPNA